MYTTFLSHRLYTATGHCLRSRTSPAKLDDNRYDVGLDLTHSYGHVLLHMMHNALYNLTRLYPEFPKPRQIFPIGDQTDIKEFQNLVYEVASSYETEPQIFWGLPDAAAARGASQLRKRARCFHLLRSSENASMTSRFHLRKQRVRCT